jgi:hypothetical protein
MRNVCTSICLALPLFCCAVPSAHAEVARFEVLSREPFSDGKSFGEVGPYERIVARVHYVLDPAKAQNRQVVDLELAPPNEKGQVEYFGDLFILAPQKLNKGNQAVFYDVNNRGGKLVLDFFNHAARSNDPVTEEHAGDGFLMRYGFTVVWSGWIGELLPGLGKLRLSPPVARDGGEAITGLVRCEIVPDDEQIRVDVSRGGHGSYWPTDKGIATATLTKRLLPLDPRVPIPRDEWQLHVSAVESESPNQLPRVEVEMAAGFKQAHIYELIYEARDPLVHGTCFTGLRDLISAFKHGTGEGNPLLVDGHPVIRRAYGFGVSQSGRFLRELMYWGFNEDEQGRRVFDGLIPHVAGGGLGSFNHRFAQPTRYVAQHEHHDYPADRFPFTYGIAADPFTKRSDSILKRLEASGHAPLVMHTQSSAEYWTRSGSLVHTDPLGRKDAEIPDNVRIYQFGGTQHGPSRFPLGPGDGQNLANPGDYRPLLRALLLALDRWSRTGQAPPPSVYPKIEEGMLVDWRKTGFPNISGVRYPSVIQQPSHFDYGPRWLSHGIIDQQPPAIRGDYRVLAARCDADGNPLGCLLPPEVKVPVATYTGWNLRSSEAGAENELVALQGSYIPFSVTKAERSEQNDPRASLEERYGTLEKYLEDLTNCCREMERQGYLLREDAERIVREQRDRVGEIFSK